jgi:hypothetical protein
MVIKSNSSLPFALGMFYVLHADGAIICGFVFDKRVGDVCVDS